MASRFTRGEIRKILGDAHTEDIENQLIALHLGVVDPMKDDLEKYKSEAGKVDGLQKQLDDIKNGKDWKAEYDKEHKAFEDYKKGVADKETLATKKRLYREILDGLKINAADADLIMAGTEFGEITIGDDGKLSDADGLKKAAGEKYKRYIPTIDEKGAHVDNPPKGGNDNGANPRAAELAKAYHERRYGPAPANGANKTE